jgi:hypothetical protein
MKQVISKSRLVIILFTSILVFSYVFVKSNVTSFTHDESFTYLNYPHDSFIQIISFSNWYMNNHVLNSLLIKYSEMLFGNSEIALRLPNILALIIYMFFCYKLVRLYNPILAISVFLILCTNILLINLFGLARGYGLSCAFMVVSLYYFIEYVTHTKKQYLYAFHFAALLATLSHFTLFTFYIAMLVVFNFIQFINLHVNSNDRFNLFKVNKVHVLPLLINALVLFEPMRRVIQHGELNIGGKTGFFQSTVSEFVVNVSNGFISSLFITVLFQLLVILCVFIPFFVICINVFEKSDVFYKKNLALIVTTFSILIISVMIVVNHHMLKADYPIGRFSIFLFPLFIFQVAFFFNFLLTVFKKKIVLTVISGIAFTESVVFISSLNLSSYGEWSYDSETKNMLQTLAYYRRLSNTEALPIKLATDWHFEPTINYYKVTHNLNWLLPVNRNVITINDEYIYAFETTVDSLKLSDYKIIKRFGDIGTVLVKNNINPIKTNLLIE